MNIPCLRPDSPRWPQPQAAMVEDGNVLLVSSEADGPGEPHALTHTVRLADGRERVIDWTFHTEMTREDFRRWLRLGMPRRPEGSYRALNSAMLEAMEREQAA